MAAHPTLTFPHSTFHVAALFGLHEPKPFIELDGSGDASYWRRKWLYYIHLGLLCLILFGVIWLSEAEYGWALVQNTPLLHVGCFWTAIEITTAAGTPTATVSHIHTYRRAKNVSVWMCVFAAIMFYMVCEEISTCNDVEPDARHAMRQCIAMVKTTLGKAAALTCSQTVDTRTRASGTCPDFLWPTSAANAWLAFQFFYASYFLVSTLATYIMSTQIIIVLEDHFTKVSVSQKVAIPLAPTASRYSYTPYGKGL